MSTITTLNSGDTGPVSRGVINTNFSNLNTDKAEVNSPTFTGTPTLPTGTIAVTQTVGDNSTKIATTAYVDSLGNNKVKCRVAKSGTQTVVSTTAQVTFDTEDFDTGANFASNAFTAPRTGYYLVNFMTSFESNASTTEATYFEVRVGGVAVLRAAATPGSSTAGEGYSVTISSLLSLSASDSLTVYCTTSSMTATILATTNTKLSILEL